MHTQIAAAQAHTLTREQQLALCGDGAQLPDEFAVEVLEAMPLVHHNVLPVVLQGRGISGEGLTAPNGTQNIPACSPRAA